MPSGYPFLQRNRKMERDRRDEEIDFLKRQLSIIGNNFNGRGVSFNTGNGEDGRLQPNMPTHMLRTNMGNRAIHEGEDVNVGSNGAFNVTPASQSTGQGTGMPGYMGGKSGISNEYLDVARNGVQDAIIPASQLGGQQALAKRGMPGYALGTNIFQNLSESIGEKVEAVKNAIPTPASVDLSNVNLGSGMNDVLSNVRNKVDAGKNAVTEYEARPTPPATVNLRNVNLGSGVNDLLSRVGERVETVKNKIADIPAQKGVTPIAPTPTDYTPIVNRGLQRLERYAEGQDPFAQQIREAEVERFKGEESAARGALSQELAQAGIGGREAITAGARQARQIGAEQSQLLGELRKGESDRAFQAAQAIPGEARASQQHEFIKKQWGEQEGERMVTDAKSMDMPTWLKAHPNATAADYDRSKEVADKQVGIEDVSTSKAAGYISNAIMQNPDYDWRTDAGGGKDYLRAAWEEQDSPGTFESWADNYVGGLKTSKGTATINALKQEDWYTNAPVGGKDADGKSIYQTDGGQYTREFYDEVLFPALSIQATIPGVKWSYNKETGAFSLTDSVTGEDITTLTGGEGETVAPTFAEMYTGFDADYEGADLTEDAFKQFYDKFERAPKNADEWQDWSINGRTYTTGVNGRREASYVMNEYLDIDDTSKESLVQWINGHGGKLPTTAKEWEDWSRTDRVYSAEDPIDVAAAQQYMGVDDSARVEQYLRDNEGKIGSASDWENWATQNPSITDVLNTRDESGFSDNMLVHDNQDNSSGITIDSLDDNELRTLLENDAGQQYFADPDSVTAINTERSFKELYGKAIRVNDKNYVVIGYGGSASGSWDKLILRDYTTGKNITITANFTSRSGDRYNPYYVTYSYNGKEVVNPDPTMPLGDALSILLS